MSHIFQLALPGRPPMHRCEPTDDYLQSSVLKVHRVLEYWVLPTIVDVAVFIGKITVT